MWVFLDFKILFVIVYSLFWLDGGIYLVWIDCALRLVYHGGQSLGAQIELVVILN